jgi:predicted nucleotidyltransferase
LIEFEPDVRVGFLGLGIIADELSKATGGRSVDLVSPKALNARIRDHVLAEAKPLYG